MYRTKPNAWMRITSGGIHTLIQFVICSPPFAGDRMRRGTEGPPCSYRELLLRLQKATGPARDRAG